MEGQIQEGERIHHDWGDSQNLKIKMYRIIILPVVMDSVVSRVARQWLRHSGVRVPLRARDFFTQKRPDRLWSPPSPLYNRYGGKSAGA